MASTSNSAGRVMAASNMASAMMSLTGRQPSSRAAWRSALAAASPFSALRALPLALGVDLLAKLALGQVVAPVAEGALGVLHNVALVHQGHAAPVVVERPADGGPHQALRAFPRDGFDADAGGIGEAQAGVILGEMLVQQGFEAGVFGRAQLELDPGVQVFGVLAEDDHIDVLRAPHRGGHALRTSAPGAGTRTGRAGGAGPR